MVVEQQPVVAAVAQLILSYRSWASCEYDRVDHSVRQFVSYSGRTLTAAETDALNRVGF
ncbi:hypothetical protein [Nocardia sp. NPDC059239]|uniref:hypothetical protein n=1 Tax=Nocardia sp. NPDC059239 TaxID=3346785 RepID=UPI0036CC10DE